MQKGTSMRVQFMLAAAVMWMGLSAREAVATEGRYGGDELAVVQQFVSGQDIPESVTADDNGNLYISVGSAVQKLTPEGELSIFGTLPLPIFALGVKVGLDGCVYTVSTSLSEVPGAFVWRICEAGNVEEVAELEPTGAPNDLAFDEAGNLFVTDPVLARIWRLTPGRAPEVFVESPLLAGDTDAPALLFRALGANGIAFDARERFVYVSNTDHGSIVRIGLRRGSGAPAEPRIFVQDPALRGADGIAFDRAGTLFVAVNAQDSIVAISPCGAIEQLAQGGVLDAPSSIVFGTTRRDRRQMYVTSSAFSRTLGLQPGTPAPALLTRRVRIGGLPLP